MAFEEVAAQSKVAFEVSDSWFDRCSPAEPLSCLSLFVVGCVFFWRFRCQYFGLSALGFAAISSIRNGDFRAILGYAFHLLESWIKCVPVIVILRQTVGSKDDSVGFSYNDRCLRSKLIFFVLLAFG